MSTHEKKYNKQILHVAPRSPARKAGLRARDVLISINGEPLIDFIDEQYFNALEHLVIRITRKNKTRDISINKDADVPLGIVYADELYPKEMVCKNRCVFCFVDQLPDGMRESLYVKDDDWRYSVLFGNFATLTNINDDELDRIISRGASPLYVSIHATDPDTRVAMMKNPRAAKIMDQLQRLADGGIVVHGQAVLCPGINDEAILSKTIEDLSALYPAVRSLAVVPVGLTRHRKSLPKIQAVDEEIARRVIHQVEEKAMGFKATLGCRFVYLSDEFYARAKMAYPRYKEAGYYEQISNGVGLFHEFTQGFEQVLNELPDVIEQKKHVLIITGTSAAGELERMAEIISKRVKNLSISIKAVTNTYFGESVTVAGLVTGQDIKNVKIDEKYDEIYVPESMLRDGDDIFLCDMSIIELEKVMGCRVIILPCDGYAFAHALAGSSVGRRK